MPKLLICDRCKDELFPAGMSDLGVRYFVDRQGRTWCEDCILDVLDNQKTT